MIARYYSVATNYLVNHRWQRQFFLLIGIFLYTSGSIFQGLDVNETVVWFSSGLGAGLILLFVLGSARTQAILSHPVLRQIGKVSYSAYLIHMLILLCLTPHLLTWLESITMNRFGLWLGGYLLTVVLVQCLSLICYYALEIPSISLGRRAANLVRTVGLGLKG